MTTAAHVPVNFQNNTDKSASGQREVVGKQRSGALPPPAGVDESGTALSRMIFRLFGFWFLFLSLSLNYRSGKVKATIQVITYILLHKQVNSLEMLLQDKIISKG